MRHVLIWFAVFIACVAFAQSHRADGASVVVNEVAVLTIRTPMGRTTPAQRALAVVANLERTRGREPALSLEGENISIVRGSVAVVRITPQEAKANGMSVTDLARRWLDNLQQALALPPLQFEVTATSVVAGQEISVKLLGSRARGAALATSDPSLLQARIERALVSLRGVAKGRVRLTAQAGDATATLEVAIVPLAANLPQRLETTVTGRPANAAVVRAAALAAISAKLVAEPGAQIRVVSTDADSIVGGYQRTVRARLSVTAPDAAPVEGEVSLLVRNLGLAKSPEAELWYCNDPENVTGPGRLFEAELVAGRPVRMLYHHMNRAERRLAISVTVSNPSEKPALVALSLGDGIPHRDPVIVGADAGLSYLRDWTTGSSVVLEVPSRSSVPLALRVLSTHQTASGLVRIQLLEGGAESLAVRTDALETAQLLPAWAAATTHEQPWGAAGPRALTAGDLDPISGTEHVYPSPRREITVEHTVGGRYTHIRVGQAPIGATNPERKLQGNFGVLYDVTVELVNPTESEAHVEFAFEASAGYSAALFAFGSEIVRIPPIRPKEEAIFRRATVPPGERRRVSFVTVPLSGSSYPATLIVRPAGANRL